jgi:hypothetical protein
MSPYKMGLSLFVFSFLLLGTSRQSPAGDCAAAIKGEGGSEEGRELEIVRIDYFSFAYSAFACFRTGISGSASFHSVRKS